MGTLSFLVRDVFSDKSSDTEYSSSSEAVTTQDKGNCVESHSRIRREEVSVGDPAPSTTSHGVGSEKIIIDISDSDEEAEPQDVEVLEVQTPTLSLVVDLSDSIVAPVSSKHNGRHVEATKELVMVSRVLPGLPLGQPEERVLPPVKESEGEARVSLGQPEERVLPAEKESKDELRVSLGQSEERVLPPVKESEGEARVPLGQPEERVLPAEKESKDELRVSLGQPEERILPAAKESEDELRVSLGQPEERILPAAKESEDELRVSLGQPEERILPAAKESEDELRVPLGRPEERILPAAKESEDELRVPLGQPEERILPAAKESEDEAKILMSPREERVFPTAEKESEDEASTISGNYKNSPGSAEVFPPDWSEYMICDMCDRGPSLSLGAWYHWCCGKPSKGCDCTYEEQQQRKRKVLTGKRVKSSKGNNPPHTLSGKVHRLCALWSAEVFQNEREPWIMMELENAMRRSRKIKCSYCGLYGATLGCRVKSCKKTYHYPCADRLSASMKVRMWDGYVQAIACKDHRHEEVKQKKRSRSGLFSPGEKASGDAKMMEIVNSDEGNLHGYTVIDTRVSDPMHRGTLPQPMGKNLLTDDISYGCEKSVKVPCTNDVDDEPAPYVEYIIKNRFQGVALGSRECAQPPLERLAKSCKGCMQYDMDDPSAPLSVHIPFERREDDDREDWLEERMYGRLPYDQYGRLVIGTKFNELVECNERCECGELCSNREMQEGLRTPLELYKTENKGWAVRTLVPIPRGEFVIEYVGEMMTQEQAQRYGQNSNYIDTKLSYLQELDYPESKKPPDFILDGFYACNAARFINHSCDPNLKMYRVYVETTYKWLSHIAFYAIRDIEAGEELAYNYTYGRHDNDGKRELQTSESSGERVKCYCGAKNCRGFLLVATLTEVSG